MSELQTLLDTDARWTARWGINGALTAALRILYVRQRCALHYV
jgi:hypothetical protein